MFAVNNIRYDTKSDIAAAGQNGPDDTLAAMRSAKVV